MNPAPAPITTTCAFERDDWLSGILGFPAYHLAGSPTAQGLATALATLPARVPAAGRVFASARVSTRAVDQVRALTAAGFYPVDASVTYRRGPQPPAEPPALRPGLTVRPATPEERLLARDIAGRCITYSRFHVDPALSPALGDAVNWAWLDSYCRGVRGEQVLIAALDGQVVGFNAILRAQVDGQPCRTVDLIGVTPAAQGRGVGRALMDRFLRDTAALGWPARVTTQVANRPAVNLYERVGFTLVESAFVLHWHRS